MSCTVHEAVEDILQGRMVIVTDDEDRENEGDFVMAASKITPDAVNFMAKVGRGLICTPISTSIAKKFQLNLMVDDNTSTHTTAFTVSIDHVKCHTGISSKDRYLTIKALTEDESKSEDFLRPGHIFPLIAQDGGVLKREGHTEASVDLMQLAGLPPVAVICEIINDDGTMARMPELKVLAGKHNFKILTIKELKKFRMLHGMQIATLM